MAALKTHYTGHAGSGTCALCGKHSDYLWTVTRDDSIKRVRICGECHDKLMANDNALFTRVMRMLD